MNYYEHHLGDYARDTSHLTMIEHGAYRLLLDRYYATEQGIPQDQVHRLARARTREEKQAVDSVLSEFFELVDGLWLNNRAGEEITKASAKINAAKENGKRGGRPRSIKPGSENETQQKPSGLFVGSENETQQKAHQTPDTRHHTTTDVVVGSAKRRIQIPTDFEPDETGRRKAVDAGLSVISELDKFTDHHRAKGSVMLDWQAAWRTWVSNAVKFAAASGQRSAGRAAESFSERDERHARERFEEATGQRQARNVIDITPTETLERIA